jgi:hypothetical protein
MLEQTTVATAPSVPERRMATRFVPGREAVGRLSIAVGGVVRPARIRDVSVSGIDLEMAQPFEQGSQLALELLNPGKHFSRSVRVMVVRAAPTEGGRWSVAFAFARALSPEELLSLF